MYIGYFRFKRFVINLIGRHIGFFAVDLFAVIGNGDFAVFKLARNVKAEVKSVVSLLNINRRVNSGVLYLAYFANRIPVLFKFSCFIRRYPGKIGLIIGINACHKLDIRTVFVGKIGAPHIAEIAYAPVPHLFAGGNMVVCNGCNTLVYSGIIARNKIHIGLSLRNKVRGRNLDRVVVRQVGSFAEVIRTRGFIKPFSDRPFKHRSSVVVVYPFAIGRKNRSVCIVNGYRKVCPPHK